MIESGVAGSDVVIISSKTNQKVQVQHVMWEIGLTIAMIYGKITD
ncbi:hypothetical protein MHB48_12640 [Psychrobacillus sp. FSL H8-0483]